MKARLVYNPSAGMRTARDQIDRALVEFGRGGWTVDAVETVEPGHTWRLAQAAADDKLDALVAVGGDGTVNEAANGLIGSETALGVLPLGTANVWAREMGLPLGDLPAGARLLTAASVRAIDVGEVRGPTLQPRVFVLWCGVGLDAAITRDVEPQRDMKRRLGALMFWLVGIRDALNYRGKRAVIHVGDRRIRRRVILALAANAQLYGGIVRIAPGAQVDDGLLNLEIFNGYGAVAIAGHLIRVLLGMHLRDPQVEVCATACVSIQARNLPVQVDGEPIGVTPVEIGVRPLALRVLVPETANQSLFKPASGMPDRNAYPAARPLS